MLFDVNNAALHARVIKAMHVHLKQDKA